MTLHHFVTNGYQGAITRKQRELFRVPPRAKLELVSPARRTKKCLLSFALRSLKRAVSGLKIQHPCPREAGDIPFTPSFRPSVRPSLPCPPPYPTPPQRPREPPRTGPGWGRPASAGHVRAQPPAVPRELRGKEAAPPQGSHRRSVRAGRDTGIGRTPGAAPQQPRPLSRIVSTSVKRSRGRPPAHCACAARAGPTREGGLRGEGGAERGAGGGFRLQVECRE